MQVNFSRKHRQFSKDYLKSKNFAEINTSVTGIFGKPNISYSINREVTVIPYSMLPISLEEANLSEKYLQKCEFIVVPYQMPRLSSDMMKSKILAIIGIPVALCADVVWVPTMFASILALPYIVERRYGRDHMQ